MTASDAVDRAVASIDFTPLAGRKVFLDDKYIVPVKTIDFVNKEYIVSTLRQQIIGSGCYLQESKEEAEIILEARVGTLGADGHEIIYGIPPNNLSSVASSVIPTAPTLPSIPEMAFMKKNSHSASSKIGVFAYDRTTREAVWQSGLAKSESTAKNMWVFGAGPFQRGEIYNGTKFAGSKLEFNETNELNVVKNTEEVENLHSRKTFKQNSPPEGLLLSQGHVQLAAIGDEPVVIGELTAIDRDRNDQHKFELVEGEGAEDNGLFQIRVRSLEIKPDVELGSIEKEVLHVRIAVKDAVSEYQEEFEIPVEKVGIQLLSAEEAVPPSSNSSSESTEQRADRNTEPGPSNDGVTSIGPSTTEENQFDQPPTLPET
ncbi:MAG: hypothetical protein KDA65_16370 [Planctomycetaceae bacterium]|nr:hypothetical protein [Planctomycetaceae bacterium]